MFDIGMFEMIMIGVIALLILGPERMPEAARAAGRWVGKARGMITGIKADVASQLSLDELNELRKLRNDLSSAQTQLNQYQNDASSALNQQIPLKANATESLAANTTSTSSKASIETDSTSNNKKKSDQA